MKPVEVHTKANVDDELHGLKTGLAIYIFGLLVLFLIIYLTKLVYTETYLKYFPI